MQFSFSTLLSFLSFSLFISQSWAIRMIASSSLNPCQANSNLTASLFDVVFTPDNNTITFNIVGVSSITGNVTAKLEVIAYGYTAITQTLDPCKEKITQLCPMNTGQIDIQSNINVSAEVVSKVPGIAYSIPDLDGKVRVYINSQPEGNTVACVEAILTNGQTVSQKGVAWTTAIIATLGLVASAVTSGLGYTNTAAHVAANAMSLFGYFQMQAMVGMAAVQLPPIARSWTSNFNWSMGIMRVGFMQKIFTWYIAATGGTPSNLLSTLSTTSVQVQKRSADLSYSLFKRAYDELVKRQSQEVQPVKIVTGINRVAFKAGIEATNLFLTGLTFFVIFIAIVVIAVSGFKVYCTVAIKQGWMKSDRFEEFRNGWKVVLKGVMYRIAVIGYPQMCVLCLWELTVRDSPAAIVLALFFFFSMTGILAWASYKVITIAKRSIAMHQNPAHILYSNPADLNRWGFLYVQFNAKAYFFIVPFLTYILLKGIFIAFAQSSGVAQAVGLVVIELAFLILIVKLRPWMDKRTNSFNISISAINFVNVVFLLIFTGVFRAPGIVVGVVGVVFFVLNAIFALVLLILLLVASGMAVFSKNPDTRYQPMRDDRGSFIKSTTDVNNVGSDLDALGKVSRGDYQNYQTEKLRNLEDDDSIMSSKVEPAYDAAPAAPNHSAASVATAAAAPAAVAAAASAYKANQNYSQGRVNEYDNRYAGAGTAPGAAAAGGYGRYDRPARQERPERQERYDRPARQDRSYDRDPYGGSQQYNQGYPPRGQSRTDSRNEYHQASRSTPQMYQQYNDSSRPGSDLPLLPPGGRSATASPRPRYNHNNGGSGSGSGAGAPSSPWQRGAGYD